MTKDQKIIKGKVGLAQAHQAARQREPGLQDASASRNSMKGCELALHEISRRKPILANRTAPEIEARIVNFRWSGRPSARSASPTK